MTGSNWTGRTARTLQQAFGPHEAGPVHQMPHKRSRFEKMADAVFAVTLGIVGAALLVHWICR